MTRKSATTLVCGAAALAMVAGLAVVSACGADQPAQQTGGSNTSNEAAPPFAPEVAEQPTANYAPEIDPSNFVKEVDNPYFPLEPGTTWVYEGKTPEGTERVEDTILRETKRVMGVECVVLRDRVWLNGELIEDTVDWHAQDKEGNVWYFGEYTKEYENGKVVSTEGSFEAGKDGALPGIIMPADPKVGDSYRQEYYKGEAEDMAEVISLRGTGLNDAVSTPLRLLQRGCSGDQGLEPARAGDPGTQVLRAGRRAHRRDQDYGTGGEDRAHRPRERMSARRGVE
jgi:hypothetical protein